MRYNVPSAKNETCDFALKIEVREEAKQGKEEVMSIMGRSRERRANANRRKKSKKCRKNKKRKSCKTKRKNVKHHKRPSTDAEVPDALQLKICARFVMFHILPICVPLLTSAYDNKQNLNLKYALKFETMLDLHKSHKCRAKSVIHAKKVRIHGANKA